MFAKNCSLDFLHESEIGSVSLCKECNHLHLEIGNLLAVVSEDSFDLIIADLQIRLEQIETSSSAEKKVFLQLTKNNLFLSLTKKEFDDTLNLFLVSKHFLSAKKILQA